MIFKEFLAKIQAIKIEESRAQTEEYFEGVISKDGLDAWHKTLTAYFGPPLKPEGRSPSGEATRHAKSHGGIRKDQTMYFRQDGDHSECALLWPWGGGARITIKVIQSKSPAPKVGWMSSLQKLFSRKP